MLDLAWKWVLLCIPLPYVAYKILTPAKQIFSALRVPFFDRYSDASPSTGNRLKRTQSVLLLLAWCALVIAVSKPQWIGESIPQPIEGRDLMLAVDLSNSMALRQLDMIVDGKAGNRLEMVKSVAGKFIDRRVGDRLGLILFGSEAYLQTPLTLDRRTVKIQLLESVIGIAGPKTAIGDAIGLAVKRMQDRPDDDKLLILLTDGENTAGEFTPKRAALLARQIKLKIYTIGIARGGVDARSLQEIAELTGGLYFRAHTTKSLTRISKLIDELEPIEKEVQSVIPIKELFYWPGGLALFLALLSILLHGYATRHAP